MENKSFDISNLIKPKSNEQIQKNNLYDSLIQWVYKYILAFSGHLSVYIVSKFGKVDQVLASANFTLIISLFIPASYVPIFHTSCLAGIMDTNNISRVEFIMLNGLIITLIYHFGSNLFLQIGGRAGFIAFLSNLILVVIQYIVSMNGLFNYEILKILYNSDRYNYLNKYIYIFGPLFASLSSLLGYIIIVNKEDHVKITIPIFYSCIITVFGCLHLLTLHIEHFSENGVIIYYSKIFIGFWHIGALASLTIKTRFKDYFKDFFFHHFIFTGYIGGWLYIAFDGLTFLGGKHGFMAFLSYFIYTLSIDYLHEHKLFIFKSNVTSDEVKIQIVK